MTYRTKHAIFFASCGKVLLCVDAQLFQCKCAVLLTGKMLLTHG